MKKITKIIAGLLLSTMTLSCFAGCGGDYEIDSTKTQLYIQLTSGGFGREWLDNAIADFEESQAQVSYEDDKMGVQLIVDYVEGANISTMATSANELIFYEDLSYINYVAQRTFLDISDVVTKVLPADNKSIADKLSKEQKDHLTSVDGNYYAIPLYESYFSFMYDVDVFDEYCLYFAEDKTQDDFVTDLSQTRSKGPDGRTGIVDGVDYSADDGLPATYVEMFKLFDRMLLRDVIPFVYTGESPNYVRKFLVALVAQMIGSQQFSAHYSMEGQVSVIDGFEEEYYHLAEGVDIPIGKEKIVDIQPSTGYQLTQEKGKYYSLAFLEAMLSNPEYYYEDVISGVFSHLDAQEEFIYGKLEGNPIGMLVDGSYWMNEAKEAIQRSIDDKGDKARNRRYAVMPLPRVVDGEVAPGKHTLIDVVNAYAFVNGNIANKPHKIKLAKAFLEYLYTDEAMQAFTVTTGTKLALDYKITEAQYQQLDYFQQSCWDWVTNADIVYMNASSDYYVKSGGLGAYTYFGDTNGMYASNLEKSGHKYSFNLPQKCLMKGISNPLFTSKEYFLGTARTSAEWENAYGEWF